MNHAEEAELIWPVLALAAQMQRVLTYGDVQDFTGIGAKYQSGSLNRIKAYCERKHYPLLNSIVVLADTRLPGAGFPISPVEMLVEQARVFAFNWLAKIPVQKILRRRNQPKLEPQVNPGCAGAVVECALRNEVKMAKRGLVVLVAFMVSVAYAQSRPIKLALTSSSNVPSADIVKDMPKQCPSVTLTLDTSKADFTMEASKTVDVLDGTDYGRFKFTLFDREGNAIFSTSTRRVP